MEDWFAVSSADHGSAPGWRPNLPAEVDELLRRGEIVSCELIPWGSNYTFCVTICHDGRECRGVYKPKRGERPLWDFPSGTLYRREYAAFLTSEAIGWSFVPPTTIRSGPHGIGSLQLYVEAEPPSSLRELQESTDLDLARIAAFDMITNNADRKAGHLLRDRSGKLWGIDQGLCFNVVPKVRTVLLHFCGQPVPSEILAELEAFRADQVRFTGLLRALSVGLEAEEVQAFLRRLDFILERRIYPVLSGYRTLPWPPF